MIRPVAMAACLCGLLSTSGGRAEVVITIHEVGSDVVTAGFGSLNLAGLDDGGGNSGFQTPGIFPLIATVYVGTLLESDTTFYGGVEGPVAFGPGQEFARPSSGSGSAFGVMVGAVLVPQGYVSGTPLSATNRYAGQTFSSLGLDPGTYVYRWRGDTLTVRIGVGDPVPEPSTLALAAIGGAGLLGYGWRRRRRA